MMVSSVGDGGRLALRLESKTKNTKESTNKSRGTENRRPYATFRLVQFGIRILK
jgi:hypothetical protein